MENKMLVKITPIKPSEEIEVKAYERNENGERELTENEFANLLFGKSGYYDSQISYNEEYNYIKIVILNF